MTINYPPKNVAPVVDEVVVQTGARIQPQPHISGPETVAINLGGQQPQFPNPRIDNLPTATRDRGYIAVRWSAHDENDDNLVYSVYYRGDNEREWKLLKSGLAEKYYSFESGLLPDGGYTVRVVASDAPSHSPEDALSDEKQSQRFEIDNTAPRIENLSARVEGQDLHVTFHAADDGSTIRRAEYSIDAGEWQYVEPVGALSDSKSIIRHAKMIDEQAASLISSMPPNWQYKTVFIDADDSAVYGNHYHLYPDHRMAQLWNSVRMTRLLLNEVIHHHISLHQHLTTVPSFVFTEYLQSCADTTQAAAARVAYRAIRRTLSGRARIGIATTLEFSPGVASASQARCTASGSRPWIAARAQNSRRACRSPVSAALSSWASSSFSEPSR